MNEQKIINLVEKLGLMSLPEEDRDAILEKTGHVVFQKVLARIMENLLDQDKVAFEALFSNEETKEEDILNFLNSKIPNLDDLVREEVSGFLKEADDIMSQITI